MHCDLAARNVLIAEGFVLKIADFGMAKEVGAKEYLRKSGKVCQSFIHSMISYIDTVVCTL